MVSILLIDDNTTTAKLIAQHLNKKGFRDVTVVNSSTDAMNLEGPFDVVVSDLWLHDIDGCDLFPKLHDRWGAVGIALTGSSNTERTTAAGFECHLMKPVSLTTLVEKLKEISAKKKNEGGKVSIAENGA